MRKTIGYIYFLIFIFIPCYLISRAYHLIFKSNFEELSLICGVIALVIVLNFFYYFFFFLKASIFPFAILSFAYIGAASFFLYALNIFFDSKLHSDGNIFYYEVHHPFALWFHKITFSSLGFITIVAFFIIIWLFWFYFVLYSLNKRSKYLTLIFIETIFVILTPLFTEFCSMWGRHSNYSWLLSFLILNFFLLVHFFPLLKIANHKIF